LGEGESFYNWQRLREKYSDHLIAIYNEMKVIFPDCGPISIYGEIYGGSYPHSDVPPVSGCKSVQNGVYYNPSIDFYPFDIMVEGHGFVTYDVLVSACTGRFVFAQPLLRGTFRECFNYDVEFISTLPGLLGLPSIDNNIAEGIVLKPVTSVFSEDGERIIIKKKHPNFEEVAFAPKAKPAPRAKTNNAIPDEAQALIDDMDRYITDNRLRNVLSKEVEVEDSKSAKANITKKLKDDVLKEFTENNPEFSTMDNNITKHVNIHLNKAVPQIIGKNWSAIVSNTF